MRNLRHKDRSHQGHGVMAKQAYRSMAYKLPHKYICPPLTTGYFRHSPPEQAASIFWRLPGGAAPR